MLLPPQPVVPQAPPPPPGRRVSRGVIVVIVVLGLLVAALGGVIVAREMSAPTDVALEPVATAGANPFMESVGTDVPDVRPVANTGGNYSGTTPGLYGGSGDNAACDRSQLTRFLGQHPDRAAGWASVLGLRDGSSSTISSYVDGLTSVVLRSDTYVTNHGWSGGEVTSWPAVLQAGTAVLVDEYGNPVTRCFCGNPLTVPQSFNTVAYVGPRWYSFTSNSVTIVTHQTTNVTNNYTIIDVHTGRGHDRPRGTGGEHDRPNDHVRETFPDHGDGQPGGPRNQGPPGNEGQPGNRPDGQEQSGNRPDGQEQSGNRPDGQEQSGNRPDGQEQSGNRPGSQGQPGNQAQPGSHGGRGGQTNQEGPNNQVQPGSQGQPGNQAQPGSQGGRGGQSNQGGALAPGQRQAPSSTTTTTTTTTAPTAPSGTWTASSSCDIGTGSLGFEDGGSLTSADGATAGSWQMSGDSLIVTPTTGSPATFTESGGSWSDGAGCTLSQG